MTALALIHDAKVVAGTAANSGGTFTADVPIPTGRSCRIEARVFMSNATDPSTPSGSLYAEGSYANRGGTVSALTALTGSINPMSSTDTAAARSEGLDAGFVGGGPSVASFSISTTNARLTLTNNGTVSADVTIYFDIYSWGSA